MEMVSANMADLQAENVTLIQGPQPSSECEDDHPPEATSSLSDQQTGNSMNDSRNYMQDAIARVMLHALENNGANGSSDYAYVQVLSPEIAQDNEILYTYPDNVPSGLIFVDSTGWLPAGEALRYLMMGYRVWNNEGRRMHLAGDATNYDSLTMPFRHLTKTICLQDVTEIPDLKVQIMTGDLFQDPPAEDATRIGMPWDARRRAPEFRKDNISLLMRVRMAWIESRYENSKPCYTLPDPQTDERHGAIQLSQSPFEFDNTVSFDTRGSNVSSLYPKVGVELECLKIQFPPIHFMVDHGNQEEEICTTEDVSCEICNSLDFKDVFEWGLDDFEITLGFTTDLIVRDKCPFCRVLAPLCEDGLEFLQRIQQGSADCSTRSREPDFHYDQPIEVLLVRNPILCLSTKPYLVLKQSYHREYLGPVISAQTIRGDFRGNCPVSFKNHVEYHKLQAMLEDCDNSHSSTCGNHKSEWTRFDDSIMLLNIKEMCLERASASSKPYVALSYVWGHKSMLRTTLANTNRFLKPGSMRDEAMPNLIKDAMTVVQELGLEYIWIDALCIIQDDEEHKQVQIEKMAQIYGNAHLTIVALAATNTDSLLPGISEPRPRLAEIVNGMLLTTRLSPLAWTAHNRVYEQRGWTFQERLISNRCLFFTERQVYFKCGNTTTSDHELRFPRNDRGRLAYPFNPLKEFTRHVLERNIDVKSSEAYSLQCLDFYCQLISQYTSRNLTYQSDIENAFLGVQNVITQTLNWNFTGGLLLGIFDWSLLWFPLGQLKRRSWTSISKNEHGVSCESKHQPPSWSWLGWEGQVSYACYTYHGKPFLENLRPRVTCYKIRRGSEEVRIYRKPSQIWHKDTQAEIEKEIHDIEQQKSSANIPTNVEGADSDFPATSEMNSKTNKASLSWLLDPSTVLEFEAETIPALVECPFGFGAYGAPFGAASAFDTGSQNLHRREHEWTADNENEDEDDQTDEAYNIKDESCDQPTTAEEEVEAVSAERSNHYAEDRNEENTIVERVFSSQINNHQQPASSDSQSEETINPQDNTTLPFGHESTSDNPSTATTPSWSNIFANSQPITNTTTLPSRHHAYPPPPSNPTPRINTHQFPLHIEWLNTGGPNGNQRHGLRHSYNDKVLVMARSLPRDRLDLVALTDCDVRETMRGGQFGEEKGFLREGVVVVMLVFWDGRDRDGDGDGARAERLAIGFVDGKEWEGLRVGGDANRERDEKGKRRDGGKVWKKIRLV